MDIAKCEVRLGGDLANSVPLTNVTPAEVLILRAIHGADAVIRIQQTGTDRRPHKEEYDRLAQKYSEAKTETGEIIFNKIFSQGFDPRLPVSFRDIGVDLVSGPDAPVADIPDLPEGDLSEMEASEPVVAVEDEQPSEPAQEEVEAPVRRRGRPRVS